MTPAAPVDSRELAEAAARWQEHGFVVLLFGFPLLPRPTGYQWEYLPHDLPLREDVWESFARWRDEGLIKSVQDVLRAQVRQQAGRETTPSAAIIDSQSVKTPGA